MGIKQKGEQKLFKFNFNDETVKITTFYIFGIAMKDIKKHTYDEIEQQQKQY